MPKWTVDDSDFRSVDDIQVPHVHGSTEHVVERISTKLNDPCLASAKSDEPIFVLRAQDLTAPVVVMLWIVCCLIFGLITARTDESWWTSDNTLRAAFEQALRMRKWKQKKLPD